MCSWKEGRECGESCHVWSVVCVACVACVGLCVACGESCVLYGESCLVDCGKRAVSVE